MSVNKVILLGYLGQDPELKYTPASQAVVSCSLATSEKWTDDKGAKHEKTEWHKIVAWGKTAEVISGHLKKGSQVYFEGKNQTRSYEKDGQTKYVTEVVVTNMQFVGSKDGGGGGRPPHPADSATVDDQAL